MNKQIRLAFHAFFHERTPPTPPNSEEFRASVFSVMFWFYSNRRLSYLLSVHLDVSDVILEHGGNVNLGELVFTEHDQQARLSTSAVPDDYQLLTDRRHLTMLTTDRSDGRSPLLWNSAIRLCI